MIYFGESPEDPSFTQPIVQGLNLVAPYYPAAVEVTATELCSVKAVPNDKFYVYTPGAGYTIGTYVFDAGLPPIIPASTNWNATATLEVGDGFWFERNSAPDTSWLQTKPY